MRRFSMRSRPALARERVPAAGIRQGDLESLPFAEHTFDAITAFNSVQYAADPAAALRELRRVAKPGALVGIVTWGAPERCESRVILAAIGGYCHRHRQVPRDHSR
jgi:ubiquinone/menaquinone biosynthesis C-methylase UbiE